MSRFLNRKSISFALVALVVIVGAFGTVAFHGSTTPTHAASTPSQHPVCQKLSQGKIQMSSGARMWCFGPQNGNGSTNVHTPMPGTTTFGTNVDAANPHEDIAPNGTQAYGQSEVSVAGVGPYVVEAWNDATGFFAPCPSPMNKEELTGYGFSANNGQSFTDKGGLPNAACATNVLDGDPSVEAWQPGGQAWFYVSSLYPSPTGVGPNDLTINACHATGTGSSAKISCSQPIIAAAPSECVSTQFGTFCSFLDKEFLSIDPARGRLYMSYTEFGVVSNFDTIEVAVCDIGTPSGGTGPNGGKAGAPVCHNGAEQSGVTGTAAPFFVVAPTPSGCAENEGAYPAVDVKKGDLYVAYEHNWDTNLFGCQDPVQNVMNYIPFSCLDIANPANVPTSSCSGPAVTKAVNIVSMDAAFIPGYNRFPMNDFPRLAVSDPFGAVSMVWNDARLHPAGDTLLKSFNLTTLKSVQSSPVRINSATGGWHFLPAVRNTDDDGDLQISFYQSAKPNTDIYDVFATIDVSPRATSTPPSNSRVTTVSSGWFDTSSDIIPNFGDYTDNYMQAQHAAPYTTQLLYVAWSDGRLGDPQPFEAPAHTN